MKFIPESSRQNILVAITIILLVNLPTFYLAIKNPTPQQKQAAVIRQISNHILLPKDESPTLAKVEDASKLSDPYLLKDAQNGDQLLLYYKAKKVYLYRPSIDKLAGVYPLILDPSRAQSVDTKLLIRSGNGAAESAQELKNRIASAYPSISLKDIEPATRQDYPHTIIIDLTDGTKYDLVTNMLSYTNAKRGVLPNGEPKPEGVDILVITGMQ